MIPAAFDYVRPSSVADSVSALRDGGEYAKILAGGQSLIPVLRLRLAYPELLIDLGDISELQGVRDDGDAITIGAMTTHDAITKDPLVAEHAPLIAKATETVGDRQVRHRGTIGGSISHADPAGDLPAVVLTYDAELVVAGSGGERRIPAREFFVDYLTTALGPDDILTAIRIPKLGPGWTAHYEKFSRVAQAWSIVAVGALVKRTNGTIEAARVGLTNMGSTPLRASAVEAALAGADASVAAIRSASQQAADGTNPPDDLSGHADYRRHLVTVLTNRALAAAAGV
jgi:carbon-monoxide dehydrogenase medium subunit